VQPPSESTDVTPWSSKVPLLDTEPPAMDSDYEEAVSSELELISEEGQQDDRRDGGGTEEEQRRQSDSRTSEQSTPRAASTSAVKPKPM